MRSSQTDRKQIFAVKLLNVLTVLAVIVMLVSLSRMVGELHRVFNRDPYSGISYKLQDGYYGDMVWNYYDRHFDVAPGSGLHEEEYYVAQYTDSAFQHQFFQTIGDGEAAEKYAGRMESALRLCGSLAPVTEDVDRLLDAVPLYP